MYEKQPRTIVDAARLPGLGLALDKVEQRMDVGVRVACLCEQACCSSHTAPAVVSERAVRTNPVTKGCNV